MSTSGNINLEVPDDQPKWFGTMSGQITDDPDTNDKKWVMSLRWSYDQQPGPYTTGSLTSEGVKQVINALSTVCKDYSGKDNQHGFDSRTNLVVRLVREYVGEDRPWHPASCPDDPTAKLQYVKKIDQLSDKHPGLNEIHLTVPYPRSRSGKTQLTIVMKDAHITDWEKPEKETTVYSAPGIVWVNKIRSLTSPTAVTKMIDPDVTCMKAISGCVARAITQGWRPDHSPAPPSLIESIDDAIVHWATLGEYPSDLLAESESSALDGRKVVMTTRNPSVLNIGLQPRSSSHVEYRKNTNKKKGGTVIWHASDTYEDKIDKSLHRMNPEDSKKMVQTMLSEMKHLTPDGYLSDMPPSSSDYKTRLASLLDMLQRSQTEWKSGEYTFEPVSQGVPDVPQWSYAAGKIPLDNKAFTLTVKFNADEGQRCFV